MLFITGIIARLLVSNFFNLKTSAYLVQGLLIFNPNSLITAHLIQSETLFTLLLAILLYYSFSFVRNVNIKNAIFTGIFCGLLALTRPSGLYILLAIPLLAFFSFVIEFKNEKLFEKLKERFYFLLLLMITSALVLMPWYLRNYIETKEVFLSKNSGYYLEDQYIQLLRIGRGWSHLEATKHIDNKLSDYFERNNIDSLCLEENMKTHWSCNDYLTNAVIHEIIKEPFANHIKALLDSWTYLYISGGASNYRNYLGLPGKNLITSFQKNNYEGIDGIVKLIRSIDFQYLFIFVFTTLFAITSRIIGLIGIYAMITTKKMHLNLVILLGVTLVFTGMYLYLGQSRFRVPIEPILMIYTFLGYKLLKNRGKHD